MADRSAIEWTDATWNPIRARNLATGKLGWFCAHASESCRNCYAEAINHRLGTGVDFKAQNRDQVEIFVDEKMLVQPLHWRRPRKIFVGSMTDLFADFVTDDMIARVFAVMALSPQHTFQVLTKRSNRMRAWFKYYARVVSPGFGERVYQLGDQVPGVEYDTPRYYAACAAATRAWPLPNVWLGASAEDQASAETRLTDLVMTPAAVRFVSYEPALGPINFKPWLWISNSLNNPTPYPMLSGPRLGESIAPAGRIDQIIFGGESGPKARPTHPDWARATRDDCDAAGVAFFMKQWGEWAPGNAFGLERDGPISDRSGNIRDFKKRYVETAIRGDRVTAHSFNEHSTNLVYRVGKKRAGRTLDGVIHDALPVQA